MPLQAAPSNLPLVISKVFAEDKMKKHLENLGISPGGEITLMSNDSKGVIVMAKGVRLALDGQTACKIFVR